MIQAAIARHAGTLADDLANLEAIFQSEGGSRLRRGVLRQARSGTLGEVGGREIVTAVGTRLLLALARRGADGTEDRRRDRRDVRSSGHFILQRRRQGRDFGSSTGETPVRDAGSSASTGGAVSASCAGGLGHRFGHRRRAIPFLGRHRLSHRHLSSTGVPGAGGGVTSQVGSTSSVFDGSSFGFIFWTRPFKRANQPPAREVFELDGVEAIQTGCHVRPLAA